MATGGMENREVRYCQSCGMPLTEEAFLGTNADGSKNEDYCSYCYQKGTFVQDCTMDEMIGFCLECDEVTQSFGSREAAQKAMEEWFPTLLRWKE